MDISVFEHYTIMAVQIVMYSVAVYAFLFTAVLASATASVVEAEPPALHDRDLPPDFAQMRAKMMERIKQKHVMVCIYVYAYT